MPSHAPPPSLREGAARRPGMRAPTAEPAPDDARRTQQQCILRSNGQEARSCRATRRRARPRSHPRSTLRPHSQGSDGHAGRATAVGLTGRSLVGRWKIPGLAIPSRVEELQHSTGPRRSRSRGSSRERAPRIRACRSCIPVCECTEQRTRMSRARLSQPMSPVRHHDWGECYATSPNRIRRAQLRLQGARRG